MVLKFYLMLVFFLSEAAFGAPVDIQKMTNKDDFSGSSEFSSVDSDGRSYLSTDTVAQYLANDSLFYVETISRTRVDNLRYRYGKELGLEMSYQYFSKTSSYGSGLFVKIIDNYFLNLTAGTSYVAEQFSHRSYSYLSSGLKIPETNLRASSTIFTETNVDDRKDYRLFYDLGLRTRPIVVSGFGFFIGANLDMGIESRVETIKRSTEVKSNLGVEF